MATALTLFMIHSFLCSFLRSVLYTVDTVAPCRLDQGSNDGVNWTLLRRHTQDDSLAKRGQVKVWGIKPQPANGKTAYSQFRIKATGYNSNWHHFLGKLDQQYYLATDNSYCRGV